MTIAWITGGGTGIGRGLAERLYAGGARVVISGRRQDVLEETARQISASPGPGEILAIAGDASDPAHAAEVTSKVLKRWGAVTLLINNAGVNFNHLVARTPPEEYLKSFELNCLSAVRTVQAVLPAMRKARRGSIVNISSVYGRWASAQSASYSVGKYAVAGYTDALRQSLIHSDIHVMGVFPGFIETDMTKPFVKPGSLKSSLSKSPDQMARAILKAIKRRKAELYFPWYVPWVLRFHRWMPVWSDRVAQGIKR